MASVPLTATDKIARQLAADLGGLEPADAAWIERILLCFPVPTAPVAPYLFESIERLVRTVPWAAEVFDALTFLEPAQRLIPKIVGLRLQRPRIYVRTSSKQLSKNFAGEFLLAKTLLVDTDLTAPRGPEAMRVALVACQWRWAATPTAHVTAIDDLAATIRVIASSELKQELVSQIGKAMSLAEFLRAAEGIKDSSNTTLAKAWRDHFEPELRGSARPAGQPKPPKPSGPVSPVGPNWEPPDPRPPEPEPPGADPIPPRPPKLPLGGPTPPGPGKPRPGGGAGTETEEDALIDRLQGGLRRGYVPRPAGTPVPMPGEPLDEVTPQILTSPLPGAPAHEDDRAMLRTQVRQAIWSTNYQLLPSHPDVLPFPDFAQVVGGLVKLLGQASSEPGLGAGASGLLIQALTGRTPRSLRALSVLASAKDDHDPDRMDLLLQEKAFRLSCFWKVSGERFEPSYFRPDQDQLLHLNPVGEAFLLPIAPAFMALLAANAGALRRLAQLPVDKIEACLREAARRVSQSEAVGFTIGQLRSSMAVHLFEQCRDTAATQLICADTLGQSVAPLSYYAPRARALAQLHWTFQGRLLDSQAPLPAAPPSEDRVGSHLLVRRDSAQAMARAPGNVLHFGVPRLLEENRVGDVHRALVGHVAGMLMAVATHRPTESLLKLTVNDILTDGDAGAALFQDKVHDAAHDPRLVALPPTVCRQLEAYLDHLSGLAVQMPSTAKQVEKIRRGDAPLLTGLSDQGRLVALDLQALKALLPENWQVLPMNWGRHWMRTHAVEQGMRPELVSMQLGHLEAAGYPFSGASPTEPCHFIEELAPGWEALSRAQGWKVVRGVPAPEGVGPVTLTPLQTWDDPIAAQKAKHRLTAKRWREAMKSQLRAYREEAETAALRHPRLVEAGIVARYLERRRGQERHALTRADFESIRDEVFAAAGDDLALAIASANAICRIAKRVNYQTRQISETPGKIFSFRRPLDNAFVPGMMKAVRQVRAMRAHISTLDVLEPQKYWADMASACACAALAMTLFGYCESPEQLRGAIERRAQRQRSATMQDVLLVPWGDAPHQVLALRGVAAIVFARLDWKWGEDALLDWNDVDAKLANLLPPWALPAASEKDKRFSTTGLLKTLCDTAAMANRYELSPAARRANALHRGSTPAHLREQLALLDGDPVGTVVRDWEQEDGQAHRSETLYEPGKRKGNARSQYLALCAAFPDAKKDTRLPLTGAAIASGEAATSESRAKLAEEIRAHLKAEEPERRLHPIVCMLADWALDLLLNGTPLAKDPALVTVEDYLTRIGGPLVHIFGQSSMADVDEAELEEAYLFAIQSKSAKDKTLRPKTAAALLLFHSHARRHYGLPAIDQSGVNLYLGVEGDGLADARLILPVERDAISNYLVREAEREVAVSDAHRGRLARHASNVMPLFGTGGLRRGEALGIQFRDVAERDGRLRIRIRPNSSRRLKTVRGRRVIDVPHTPPAGAELTLSQWVDVERARLRQRSLETAYVFTATDEPFDAKVRTEIAERCLEACRTVTGRKHARLHSFRHLVAMERTTPVFLTPEDQIALAGRLDFAPVRTRQNGVALPRDLLGQVVELGHADPATTLDSYHHVPWLLRSHSEARLAAQYVNRKTLSPLLGVSPHTLDWAAKQRPGRDRVAAWLDVGADIREVPGAPGPDAPATEPAGSPSPAPWTVKTLAALLDDVARVGSLEKVLAVRGERISAAAPLRLVLQPMEGRLGRRLLVERGRPTYRGAPRRPVKRVGKGRELEVLWDWFEGDDNNRRTQVAQIAATLYEYLQPAQGDRICLPTAQAAQLRQLLTEIGVGTARIVREPDQAGLQIMRVLRVDPAATEKTDEPNAKGGAKAQDRYVGLVLKRTLLLIRAIGQLA